MADNLTAEQRKKNMQNIKSKDILKNSMRQLLIDVVSETVKKSLFQ